MKILKYPANVVECNCGCVFSFNQEDVVTKEKGYQRDSYYVFSVHCPVCNEEISLDSSDAVRPYPIENEGVEDVCCRIFSSLKPKRARTK